MDIVACIKRVPDTSKADVLKIDASQREIEKGGLVFKINDWDEYVLETAAQLKEKQGGTFNHGRSQRLGRHFEKSPCHGC